MASAHILVLNWHFPPHEGIGGRRTALLAEQWISKGIEVTVIAKKPHPNGKKSDWIDDSVLNQIHLVHIDHENPYNVLFFKSDSRSKWLRVWKKFYYNFFAVGNPIDQTFFCGPEITKAIEAVHAQKKIDWIFTSGAPFYLAYWASLFKAKNHDIRLWCDFRDPWLNAINYGMLHLSAPQRKGDDAVRDFVTHYADFISAPYPEILEEFESDDPIEKMHIPHFHSHKQLMEGRSNHHWVYAGEIYEHTALLWEKAIAQLELKSRAIQVEIYTQHTDRLASIATSPIALISSGIGKSIEEKLASCEHIIISLGEHNKDFFTTKFFDHLTYQKPYLYIGPEGKVSRFITENKLGLRWEDFGDPSFEYNSALSLELWEQHKAEKMAGLILEKMQIHA